MRKAIMLGAALLFAGLAGCHGVSPPKTPTPNADLQGEANHTAEGVDPKTGSTVNASESPADKPGGAADTKDKGPPEKPAPAEPPAPPPKP